MIVVVAAVIEVSFHLYIVGVIVHGQDAAAFAVGPITVFLLDPVVPGHGEGAAVHDDHVLSLGHIAIYSQRSHVLRSGGIAASVVGQAGAADIELAADGLDIAGHGQVVAVEIHLSVVAPEGDPLLVDRADRHIASKLFHAEIALPADVRGPFRLQDRDPGVVICKGDCDRIRALEQDPVGVGCPERSIAGQGLVKARADLQGPGCQHVTHLLTVFVMIVVVAAVIEVSFHLYIVGVIVHGQDAAATTIADRGLPGPAVSLDIAALDPIVAGHSHGSASDKQDAACLEEAAADRQSMAVEVHDAVLDDGVAGDGQVCLQGPGLDHGLALQARAEGCIRCRLLFGRGLGNLSRSCSRGICRGKGFKGALLSVLCRRLLCYDRLFLGRIGFGIHGLEILLLSRFSRGLFGLNGILFGSVCHEFRVPGGGIRRLLSQGLILPGGVCRGVLCEEFVLPGRLLCGILCLEAVFPGRIRRRLLSQGLVLPGRICRGILCKEFIPTSGLLCGVLTLEDILSCPVCRKSAVRGGVCRLEGILPGRICSRIPGQESIFLRGFRGGIRCIKDARAGRILLEGVLTKGLRRQSRIVLRQAV